MQRPPPKRHSIPVPTNDDEEARPTQPPSPLAFRVREYELERVGVLSAPLDGWDDIERDDGSPESQRTVRPSHYATHLPPDAIGDAADPRRDLRLDAPFSEESAEAARR